MTYNIPIIWQSYKRVEVDAENLQDAVTKALKQFLSEPDEFYIEASFEIDGVIHEEIPNETFDINTIYNNL